MYKNFIKSFLVIVLLFVCFNSVEASTNAHLKVSVGSNNLYDSDMLILECDNNNDGVVDGVTAYCALSQSGLNVDGSWSSYGYFINGINGVNGYADELGDWHYWEFYTNNTYAPVGVASYTPSEGDILWLKFLNPSSEDLSKSSKSHSGGVVVRDEFSKKNAFNFILSKQQEDGSFGISLYTDWTAIGIAKEDLISEDAKNKLINFLKNEDFKAQNITDYERHAMALMALGIDPYDGTNQNYIKQILDSFDGQQIGDKDLINDDIFGLIVLQNAGFKIDDEIISTLIDYILSKQKENGSWGSVDMTSASIMSLHDFNNIDKVEKSIRHAYKFLKKNEIIKGCKSFGNAFSTSWAMQAFGLEDWYTDEVERSLEYLTKKQKNEDGYIREGENESILWATIYSIPAISNLSWNQILDDFSKKN